MTASPSPASSPGISHMDALPVGARLAEFEILALLGVGGFGMVYKAFDHSLHRPVAIKEYMPSALAGRAQGQSLWVRSSSDQQTFQAGLDSFVGEARLLAQFDHPSLVKVFRFWEANGTAYMVMPLYTGMTFKQARAQMRTPPPEAWLRKLLWSVLGALRVLHDGKTLHRDISPDNIFLQDNGPPVLLDLGAARHAINDQDRKHTAVLKVNYAPIEQYSDGDEELRQGPWSDLYSLAAVVHGCLCNDTPLPATLRSIRDRMVPFSRVARTVKRQFGVEYSASFVTAISQSLSLRPEDRPQNIDAFLQLMDMTTPPEGVEHFDFRADLGSIWVEPDGGQGQGFVTPLVDLTSVPLSAAMQDGTAPDAPEPVDLGGDTVMMAGPDTVAEDAGDTVAFDDSEHHQEPELESRRVQARSTANGTVGSGSRRSPPAKSAKSGKKRVPMAAWFAVAAFAVVAAGAGLRWAQGGKAAQDDDIITELAEPQAPASAAQAAVPPEPAASAPAPVAVVADAPTSAASAPPDPAYATASVPRPAPRVPPAKRVVTESPPAPAAVHEEPPPPPPPPVVAEPKARPVAPRLPSPQEVCADASFLVRPMCIHQECQKPAQASQPICVENRRKYEAEEQRRRQGLN
ncbi:MAG: serine/threonine-protein kinase [Acidovorax sp.]|uniref:serine/threonine protein kinase n=1 Tax=Acidovorax sp. TaxID=1872122 RepID=UPI0039E4009C